VEREQYLEAHACAIKDRVTKDARFLSTFYCLPRLVCLSMRLCVCVSVCLCVCVSVSLFLLGLCVYVSICLHSRVSVFLSLSVSLSFFLSVFFFRVSAVFVSCPCRFRVRVCVGGWVGGWARGWVGVRVSDCGCMSACVHAFESSLAYEWVTSHSWMSHVRRMNELCPTYEWVMSHVCMSHVPNMNESCRIDYVAQPRHVEVGVAPWRVLVCYSVLQRVAVWYCVLQCFAVAVGAGVARRRINHEKYAWVMSNMWRIMFHIWMSHIPYMHESCRTGCIWTRARSTYEWKMSHVWMGHV